MMGSKVEPASEVPCGNTIGLVGVDQYIVKQGTISDSDEAHTIKAMKFSVSPVVRVSVRPQNVSDLPKLINGLKSLANSDSLVQCFTEETGEHIVAGCGELHLEICLKELNEQAQCPIIVDEPVVTYKETVTAESSIQCLAKSQNKHNRLYARAEPLASELCEAIEDKTISFLKDDNKEFAKQLVDLYGWDPNDSKKIWCFGPDQSGPNALVDQTKGVAFVNEIKDSVSGAFQWAAKEGAMTSEAMRGVRINIVDCNLIADSIHRGDGQIIPAARRVIYAAQLTATPRLVEPIYLCEI